VKRGDANDWAQLVPHEKTNSHFARRSKIERAHRQSRVQLQRSLSHRAASATVERGDENGWPQLDPHEETSSHFARRSEIERAHRQSRVQLQSRLSHRAASATVERSDENGWPQLVPHEETSNHFGRRSEIERAHMQCRVQMQSRLSHCGAQRREWQAAACPARGDEQSLCT
jgi:hypothetical protein